jgi:hypothetical protein
MTPPMTTVTAVRLVTALLARLDNFGCAFAQPPSTAEREAIRFLRDLAANSPLQRKAKGDTK